MRSRIGRAVPLFGLLSLLAAATAVGCSDDTDNKDDAGPVADTGGPLDTNNNDTGDDAGDDAGPGGDTGGPLDNGVAADTTSAADANGSMVITSMLWAAASNGFVSAGLAGATVCAYLNGKKSTQCTQTDANGIYSISLPTNTKTGIFLDKTGWEHAFLPLWVTPTQKMPTFAVWSDADAKAAYATGGGTYPLTTLGQIQVLANSGQGASFSISPAGGTGPLYWNLAKNGFDSSLTAMQVTWAAALDVPPGQYEVTCTHSTKSCTLMTGWPTSPPKANSTKIEVVAGYTNVVTFMCY